MKYTVVFDFDGVIHSYKSGWKSAEVIPDPPVEGIREAIADIRNADYEVAVVSTRCATPAGLVAVKTYLANYDIIVDKVCAEKPPAIVYIDDRALCFDGQCHTLLEKIKNFKPWYSQATLDKSQNKCEGCAGCTQWLCECSNVRADAICEYKRELISKIVNTPTKKQENGLDYLNGVAERQHEIIDIIRGSDETLTNKSHIRKPCFMCDNARVNPELTDGNDFASFTIGEACKNFRIMFTVGSGKPPRIEFETWNNDHWSTVGVYYPKHCPNCGREINEYGEQDNAE